MIQSHEYGTLANGLAVTLFELTNNNGMSLELIDYGASLVSLKTHDKSGKIDDVALGWDDIEGWAENSCYFGATVGRYANRIAKGQFSIDGVNYDVATNNGPNHLHGGIVGFNKKMWNASTSETENSSSVKFRYTSPDGEEGYPGTLSVSVTYTLTDSGEVQIDYEAITDKTTIINLTHHSYWNLAGHSSDTILDHELQLNASNYLPVDDTSIPTGEVCSVKDTPMDFLTPHIIGDRIEDIDGGYDHNWCLDAYDGSSTFLAAILRHHASGRVMEMETTEPGVQFYSANYLSGEKGKDGVLYPRRSGLCLEAQKWPDSPNRPEFPSAILKPGETYRQTCIYRFYTE